MNETLLCNMGESDVLWSGATLARVVLLPIAVIVIAIVLGNVITSPCFYQIPRVCYMNFEIWCRRKLIMGHHPFFFQEWSSWNMYNEKKGLILCHGRNHGYPVLEIDGKLQHMQFCTVDKRARTWPHVICDVTKLKQKFPEWHECFDVVILCNCSCCTSSIHEDTTIFDTLKDVLNENGILMIKKSAYFKKYLKKRGFESNNVLKSKISFKELPSYLKVGHKLYESDYEEADEEYENACNPDHFTNTFSLTCFQKCQLVKTGKTDEIDETDKNDATAEVKAATETQIPDDTTDASSDDESSDSSMKRPRRISSSCNLASSIPDFE